MGKEKTTDSKFSRRTVERTHKVWLHGKSYWLTLEEFQSIHNDEMVGKKDEIENKACKVLGIDDDTVHAGLAPANKI